MKTTVKLSEIIEGMEMQSDEMSGYVNIKTGEVTWASSDDLLFAEDEDEDIDLSDYPEWQQETIKQAQKILFSEDYLSLPSKFDIHDYSIMEDFCLSLEDERLRDKMFNAIKRKGAFGNFKYYILEHNIEKDWYRFRESAYKEIAVGWCEDNDIQYNDDVVVKEPEIFEKHDKSGQPDTDKIDEYTLALLYLVMQEDDYGTRAWKGFDWKTLNRLHEKGFISNPKGKSKSVAVSKGGYRKAKEMFKKLFVDNL